ncbi:MAG: hypothetical protein KGI95_19420, partial [Pseudomonas sp.]|nr:hypothetical protein [Pseudomonas sp.]
ANKSIAAYLVKSRYELLRADGSQLGPTLTYASGDNVYFSELLQPEAAVTAVEEPEEVPAAVPEPTENNLEITPHDFIDDTLLP